MLRVPLQRVVTQSPPPWFLLSASLFATNAVLLTFVNVGGRTMWKVPLRTELITSLNWRHLLLTWLWEFLASSHDLSQYCTRWLMAISNFAAKKSSKAILSWKHFLFQRIVLRRLLRHLVRMLLSLKNIADAYLNSWTWVPRPLTSEGTWTDCYKEGNPEYPRLDPPNF